MTPVELIRYPERPELWTEIADLDDEVWPEYNKHGDVLNEYWGRLFDDFPGYQFLLYEEEVLAEGNTIPCSWDGTVEGLGDGIDAIVAAAFADREADRRPNTLSALAAKVRPRFQGRGLAGTMLDAMAELARRDDLTHLIAPVRPSFKARYPITPIERYVTWTNNAGDPFDPWIRVHLRRGGTIAKPAPNSLRITGTVAEWEEWTGVRFPDDGAYTFPDGLAPVEIDRAADRGAYWEPNVWIVHSL